MAMIDPFGPLKYKQDFKSLGIDGDKFYFIAFFNGDKLDTRPIKLTSVFGVHSSNVGSVYLRTEAEFEYHFETEKTIVKKIVDPSFWLRLFGFGTKLTSQKITEKWKINFKEEWDTIDYYLVAETPDLAKLKLIMAAQKTPYPSDEKLEVINKEMEYYQEYQPDLLLKAMAFEISGQYGDITDYGDKFLNIEGDLRNGI